MNPHKLNFIANFNPLKITNVLTFSLCRPQKKTSLINSELIFEHLVNVALTLKKAGALFFKCRPILACSPKIAQSSIQLQHTCSMLN